MADIVEFLLYSKETAEAIKKAKRLPPIPGEESYHRKNPKQQMLPRRVQPVQASGSLQLLKLTTPPNGDGGAAMGKIITVNSDGTYTEENTEISVICLALN